MLMDNWYSCPQLLALMSTLHNVRGVGTCKANRKGFELDNLKAPNNCLRGVRIGKVDDVLGMVITRWKDSRALQTVNTIMEKGISTVQRTVGKEKQMLGVEMMLLNMKNTLEVLIEVTSIEFQVQGFQMSLI